MTFERLPSGSVRVTAWLSGRRLRATAPNMTEARRLRIRLLAELEDEMTDSGRARRGTSGRTVGQLLEQHAALADYAATTQAEVDRFIRRLPADFKARPVAAVDASHLDRLYGQLARDGWPAPQIRRMHQTLGAAFERARRWRWIRTNPVRDAAAPKVEHRDPTPADPDAVARILAAVADDLPFTTFVVLAAVTGARRGELCGLRWPDLDLDRGAVWIRRAVAYTPAAGVHVKDTKTGSRGRRQVTVDDGTLALIRRYRAAQAAAHLSAGVTFGDGFVFVSDDLTSPWYPDRVTRRWGRLCARLGIDGVRLHDLRHAAATVLLSSGMGAHAVAGRLGHARASTTLDVYAAFAPNDDRRAAEILGARLRHVHPSG